MAQPAAFAIVTMVAGEEGGVASSSSSSRRRRRSRVPVAIAWASVYPSTEYDEISST
jgi:hypothetical protein